MSIFTSISLLSHYVFIVSFLSSLPISLVIFLPLSFSTLSFLFFLLYLFQYLSLKLCLFPSLFHKKECFLIKDRISVGPACSILNPMEIKINQLINQSIIISVINIFIPHHLCFLTYKYILSKKFSNLN